MSQQEYPGVNACAKSQRRVVCVCIVGCCVLAYGLRFMGGTWMTTGLYWLRDGVCGAVLCLILVGGALSTIGHVIGERSLCVAVCIGVHLLFLLCYGTLIAALVS